MGGLSQYWLAQAHEQFGIRLLRACDWFHPKQRHCTTWFSNHLPPRPALVSGSPPPPLAALHTPPHPPLQRKHKVQVMAERGPAWSVHSTCVFHGLRIEILGRTRSIRTRTGTKMPWIPVRALGSHQQPSHLFSVRTIGMHDNRQTCRPCMLHMDVRAAPEKATAAMAPSSCPSVSPGQGRQGTVAGPGRTPGRPAGFPAAVRCTAMPGRQQHDVVDRPTQAPCPAVVGAGGVQCRTDSSSSVRRLCVRTLIKTPRRVKITRRL